MARRGPGRAERHDGAERRGAVWKSTSGARRDVNLDLAGHAATKAPGDWDAIFIFGGYGADGCIPSHSFVACLEVDEHRRVLGSWIPTKPQVEPVGTATGSRPSRTGTVLTSSGAPGRGRHARGGGSRSGSRVPQRLCHPQPATTASPRLAHRDRHGPAPRASPPCRATATRVRSRAGTTTSSAARRPARTARRTRRRVSRATTSTSSRPATRRSCGAHPRGHAELRPAVDCRERRSRPRRRAVRGGAHDASSKGGQGERDARASARERAHNQSHVGLRCQKGGF